MHRVNEECFSFLHSRCYTFLAAFPKIEVCASVESACIHYPHCINVANDDNIDLNG